MKLHHRLRRFFRFVLTTVFISGWMFMLLPYLIPLTAGSQTFFEKPFPESRYLRMFGTWVHYRTFEPRNDSNAKPVFLVHGFSGSTFSWRYTIPALLNSGYSVTAIDLPPFGFSDKRRSANVCDSIWPDMIAAVMDVVSFERRMGQEQWILIGHSMGGMVIGAFATEYPSYSRALVYVDGTSPDSDGKRPFSLRAAGSILRLGFIQRWADVAMEQFIFNEKRFTDLLRSAYGKDPDADAVQGYMRPFSFYGSASSIFRFSSNAGFARVDHRLLQSKPRLLLWGEKDSWIPVEGGRNFIKANPDVEGYFFPEAGHCPMETHSDEFNSILISWLNEL